MPTFDYQCTACKTVQEEFHLISATPKIKCNECGRNLIFDLIEGEPAIWCPQCGKDYSHELIEDNESTVSRITREHGHNKVSCHCGVKNGRGIQHSGV